MHSVEDMLVEKNYSKCPLKKRPVTYQFDDACSTSSANECDPQPENLSLKKSSCDSAISSAHSTTSSDELINVSDCCEDEGVDVDHTDLDEDDEDCCHLTNDAEVDDEDEMIDCVDIEENQENTTQAAALAAAAAVAAASAAAASVVVPTPTYPKYGLQPWNFHMSPYTAEFYRTINQPHLGQQQISPLRGDLLSPSSPSDSIGSLSPPPHYLHGRASSVSPPMRSEIIHRPIGVRAPQQQSSPHHHHRFMPYALPAAAAAYHALTPTPGYPLSYHAAAALTAPHHTTLPHHPAQPLHPHHPMSNHHAPISPAYSESSFYSMRSLTPESSCSTTLPEDLSVKHHAASKSKTSESTEKSQSSASTSGSPSKKEKSSAPPRYQCPDCQKSYSTFSGLTKHQQFHCPAAEGNQVKKSFSCKDCDKTYVSLGALKMHIRTHTLPCKCNICGKAFSRPWLLQGHIRTHTGEKPFSCQHCHRAFADRSNLRAHLQTHSDIKKYSCSSCSKTFSRMSLLTKHSEGGCSNSSCAPPNSSGSEVSSSSSSSYPAAAVYAEH